VLQPTKHWQSDEIAVSRWWLAKLRVWIWYTVNRLRRTGSIVILDKLGHDFSDVLDAKKDEMVQSSEIPSILT